MYFGICDPVLPRSQQKAAVRLEDGFLFSRKLHWNFLIALGQNLGFRYLVTFALLTLVVWVDGDAGEYFNFLLFTFYSWLPRGIVGNFWIPPTFASDPPAPLPHKGGSKLLSRFSQEIPQWAYNFELCLCVFTRLEGLPGKKLIVLHRARL